MTAISSPCVKLCQLDPATRHCLGCGRSLDEIGRWSSLSETERRAIMARLLSQTTRKA
ncbi:putative Fe-S protein YdhL (DUF1289 family) [Bosea sp. OAE506]|uniref:DUF1289 domain-containing protein n=1 Tax=Bosea sp. OAE506 TaxID=2663870 RepID=UPI0017899311